MIDRQSSNRREFLRLTALGAASATVLAACAPAATPTAAPAAAPKAAEPTKAAAAPAAAEPTKAPAAAAAPAAKEITGSLEIISWWTSGGEVEALEALYAIFKKRNPKVEIINSAMTGGSSHGGNMKAVLLTRMMGGDPPESFQVHLGHELTDNHVVAGRMLPVDHIYKDEGWDKVMPKGVIDIASHQGKPYAVPVNIHRANVLWYNTKIFESVGVTAAPKTWDEYFAAGDKLKEKNIPLIGVAENAPGFYAHVTECILLSVLGPAGYRGLFDGTTKWSDAKVTESLQIAAKLIGYANPDFASTAWGDINDLFVAGKVASILMGDWTPGVLWSKGFKDFKWVASPGTAGWYNMLSDSFGLPKGVKNQAAAEDWLKVCGSKEGHEQFNFVKGSIPARTDCDVSKYTEYHKDAIKDWTDPKTEIVPSIVHGAATGEAFNVDYQTAINILATKKDVKACQDALVKAATAANFKK